MLNKNKLFYKQFYVKFIAVTIRFLLSIHSLRIKEHTFLQIKFSTH